MQSSRVIARWPAARKPDVANFRLGAPGSSSAHASAGRTGPRRLTVRRRGNRRLRALLAATAAALSACGGGSAPISPMADSAPMRLDAPANHGLAPLEQFEVQPGGSEEHGNVVIACPAGGPGCVLRVAADGFLEYEHTGGRPSVALVTFTAGEIAGSLGDLQRVGSGTALVWHGARYPRPESAVCLALIIGCEGGLGPIHYGSVKGLDVADFVFLGRRNDVSLADKTVVAQETGRPSYRALAGWMDHSFFLIETPRRGVPPGGTARDHRYYRAYSAGNATGTDPDLSGGAAARWSGVMWGLLMTNPDQSEPDAFVRGDATVTVSSLQGNADFMVNVAFTNIRHEATGARIEDLRWRDLPLRSGSFGISPVNADAAEISRHPASQGISGRFYGPNHEEAGGLFGRREVSLDAHAAAGVRAEVSGAFGARRH